MLSYNDIPNGVHIIKDSSISLASGISAFEAKQFSRAMQLLNPLAIDGNPDAQYRVAVMYQNGLGVVRNEPMAVKWMTEAATAGLALAQHGLGFMYMEGDCIEQDGPLAVRWFTLSAEQGLVGSQTTLAMIYEQGIGIPQDPEKAREWYSKAGFNDKL